MVTEHTFGALFAVERAFWQRPLFLFLMSWAVAGCGQAGSSTASNSSTVASSATKPVLVVVGLTQEAQIANGPGVITLVSGGNPAQLQTLLSPYTANNVRAVISFGIAGGLNPNLKPGDLVVPSTVVDPDTGAHWSTSASLTAAFMSVLKPMAQTKGFTLLGGTSAGSATDAASIATKTALYQGSGANAIDMESQVAAQFAQAQGLPFAVVRSVADPASLDQPTAATIALLPDGSANIDAIISSIATNPLQIPGLIEVALDTEAAYTTLTACQSTLSSIP